jgi:hypothetical protein
MDSLVQSSPHCSPVPTSGGRGGYSCPDQTGPTRHTCPTKVAVRRVSAILPLVSVFQTQRQVPLRQQLIVHRLAPVVDVGRVRLRAIGERQKQIRQLRVAMLQPSASPRCSALDGRKARRRSTARLPKIRQGECAVSWHGLSLRHRISHAEAPAPWVGSKNRRCRSRSCSTHAIFHFFSAAFLPAGEGRGKRPSSQGTRTPEAPLRGHP